MSSTGTATSAPGPTVGVATRDRARPDIGRRSALLTGAAVACAAVGVLMRWLPRSALWLDEAQSVSFAKLAVRSIPGALREDGAPPAYYVLLHGWMAVFGDGDFAVRALSATVSTATLVVLWAWTRRRWGRTVALVAVGLMATSPFAIRYATEARMYALVMLEVVVGLWLIDRVWHRPSPVGLLAATLISALLLYTHYWGIYLVVAGVITLVVAGRRPGGPPRALAWAVAAGFVLWLPWFPTFVFQSLHTGTPWAAPASVTAAMQAFSPNLGGPTLIVALFGAGMGVAFLVGAAGRRGRRSPSASVLALVAVGTLAIGVFGAIVSGSAVSTRYLAVAVPLVIVVAAVGVAGCEPRRRTAAFLALGTTGVLLGGVDIVTPRTTASAIVDEITARSQPGDVVVYCPDQLAPAMHRLLARRGVALAEVVYPQGSTPRRVDWIDYGERAAKSEPLFFANGILRDDPPNIWLVLSMTYPPTQQACRGLLTALVTSGRGVARLSPDKDLVEHGALWWFERPAVLVRQ
jgi:mannosyltransferase